MIISNKVKNLLNAMTPLFERITFGDIIQRMQQDIDAGGGGGVSDAANVGTGLGVYRDKIATVVNLRKILAGANMSATIVGDDIRLDAATAFSTQYVFWPSAPAQAGNVYKVWADLYAAISALPEGATPEITFRETFAIPAAGMPVGGWDMRLGTWRSVIIATGSVTVTIADGVKIKNLVQIENGLSVIASPTTADGVFKTDLLGGLDILIVALGAQLVNTGTKALIDSAGQVVMVLNGATQNIPPANTGPFVKANGTDGITAIMLGDSPNTIWFDDWIIGGNVGSQLIYVHGITFTNPTLSSWTGDAPVFSTAGKAVNLTDFPDSYTGHAGKVLKVNPGETGVEFVAGGAGVTNFTDLGDVPAAYTGQTLKAVRVNAGETGLEFYTPSGGAGDPQYEIIFDPAAATETDNLKNTFQSLMARVGALSPEPVTVTVRKAGVNQVIAVPLTGMPGPGWDFERVAWVSAADSVLPILDFADGTLIQNMFSYAQGVKFRFNNTTAPVCSVAGLKAIGFQDAGLVNNGTEAIMDITVGAQLVTVSRGTVGPFTGAGAGTEPVSISGGNVQVDIESQTLANGFLSTNNLFKGASGGLVVNAYTFVPGGINRTDANFSGTTTNNAYSETRANELIKAIAEPAPVLIAATSAITSERVVEATNTITLTLPDPTATPSGRTLKIKNVGVGTVTLAEAVGGVDGIVSYPMATQNQSVFLICNGAQWSIFASHPG